MNNRTLIAVGAIAAILIVAGAGYYLITNGHEAKIEIHIHTTNDSTVAVDAWVNDKKIVSNEQLIRFGTISKVQTVKFSIFTDSVDVVIYTTAVGRSGPNNLVFIHDDTKNITVSAGGYYVVHMYI